MDGMLGQDWMDGWNVRIGWDGRLDGVDGWVGGQLVGGLAGWMDKQTEKQTGKYKRSILTGYAFITT